MDIARLWALWQTHKKQSSLIIAGLLILAIGWQLGRITSPYYAAHPIIFNESPIADENNGSLESLIELREEVEQLRNPSTEKDSAGTVQAATSTATPSPAPPTASQEKVFAGSRNSNLYHHISCSAWQRIKEENIIWWSTREQAEAAGYSPSKCTSELLGI
jgi:hypothetical protein